MRKMIILVRGHVFYLRNGSLLIRERDGYTSTFNRQYIELMSVRHAEKECGLFQTWETCTFS